MNIEFVGASPDFHKRGPHHSHNEWEIVYYVYGTGTLTIGAEQLVFKPGDIVFLPPYILHSEYSQEGFKDLYIRVSDFQISRTDHHIVYHNVNEFIKVLFNQIYIEFHLNQNRSTRIVRSLFDILYQYLISENFQILKNPYVEQFKSTIISNLPNNNFKIENEILKVPLAKEYFRKIFKAETGKTPLQYLTENRINYARNLLENKVVTLMKINEIANLSGFTDYYYFSRVFKKVTGQSPQQYYLNYNKADTTL